MPVTIHDVARRSGVSISTVSRVLNGTAPVRDDKRRLVLEAADALGYAPNPAARSLLGKRTGGLGVLLPFVIGEFFSELLTGLDEVAQDHDRFLVVSTSHRRPDDFKRAAQALDRRVDGLIVMAPEIDAAGVAAILQTDAPVVFLNTRADGGLPADVLNFDNYGGSYALTEHLLAAGHRRVALLHGPPEAWDARERARGYRDAMAAAGLGTEGLEFDAGFSREAGYAAAETALAACPDLTAMVAANDDCAQGVMSRLHEAGVAVPDEVAVCGFDGLPSSPFAIPPLTTAHVPIRDLGERAIRRLLARIEGTAPAAPEQIEAPVEVVVRASTAPAGSEG